MSDQTDRPIIGAKPLKDFTLWELAQAIALASDQATYFEYKQSKTEEEVDSDLAYAARCFAVRNDCIREIRDREQRGQT